MSEIPRRDTTPNVIIEREGKRFLVLALTDLDGTANDETRPESDRLATVGPAKEAYSFLESLGIPVGIITSRATGETLHYEKALGISGPIICEDGGVILPSVPSDIAKLSRVGTVVSHEEREAVLLSPITTEIIKELLGLVRSKIPEHFFVASTDEDSLKRIQKLLGHATLEDAVGSVSRLASAFVINPSEDERSLIYTLANQRGMRILGSPNFFHLMGENVHKGTALKVLLNNASTFFPGIDGIIPLVIGNGVNDVELFRAAEEAGGVSVIVTKPEGGYVVPDSELPNTTIRATLPFGYGIQQALPLILATLDDRYGTTLFQQK